MKRAAPKDGPTPTATADQPIVTIDGVVEVDLRDLDAWPEVSVVRSRLVEIEHAPPGALIRLHVGEVAPIDMLVSGFRISRVRFEIVGDVQHVQDWIRTLRNATG